MTPIELVNLAKEARTHAYVPYSGYAVGAALLCADGTVYQGCNIENASYSPTVCAERVAVFKAVYDGRRDFAAIAVVGGPEGGPAETFCAPCGVCRQVMVEFCDLASGPAGVLRPGFQAVSGQREQRICGNDFGRFAAPELFKGRYEIAFCEVLTNL